MTTRLRWPTEIRSSAEFHPYKGDPTENDFSSSVTLRYTREWPCTESGHLEKKAIIKNISFSLLFPKQKVEKSNGLRKTCGNNENFIFLKSVVAKIDTDLKNRLKIRVVCNPFSNVHEINVHNRILKRM